MRNLTSTLQARTHENASINYLSLEYILTSKKIDRNNKTLLGLRARSVKERKKVPETQGVQYKVS